MRKGTKIAGTGLAVSLMFSGCGGSKAETQSTPKRQDVSYIKEMTEIHPGEVKFLESIDANDETAKSLRSGLPMVDHMYPRGSADAEAPTISEDPARLRAIVVLQGRDPTNLAQDAACDTLKISDYENIRYIGAVALGGKENGVFISWPHGEDDKNSEYAYMCSFQEMEPKDHGVVIYTENREL